MSANRLRGRTDSAIVLRTYKFGEADRIVVLLSEEGGKLRAVAKGVRKGKSRFGARLEPSSCIKVELYRGQGELYTIVGAEAISHYRNIREDLTRLLKVSRMLEIVDSITLDDVPHPGLYQILKGALETLEAGDSEMLLAGFLWRVLQNEGMAPHHEECSICGSESNLVNYDLRDGGLTCAQHPKGTAISPQALIVLQEILGGKLRQALKRADKTAANELEWLAEKVLQSHSERSLKSLKATHPAQSL